MIRINQVKLPIFEVGTDKEKELKLLKARAAALLKCGKEDIRKLRIHKRSVDAREKNNILFVYTVDLRLHDSVVGTSARTESEYVERLRNNNIHQLHETPLVLPIPKAETAERELSDPCRENKDEIGACDRNSQGDSQSPVIVGSGPCGLFTAYVLAECGKKPIILERGEDVDKRIQRTELFFETGKLDTESNIQFGEGGAGTFSDGKLNTSIKDRGGYIDFVLKTFVRFGADPEILTEQKPHIGTDVLVDVIKNMREYIISKGGSYIFNACFCDYKTEDGHIVSAIYTDRRKEARHELKCSELILATGHSARDTFYMLRDKGLDMEAKPFAVGVRIQHPQELIDRALYGAERLREKQEILGPASYKLARRARNGRSCFSFCMCPGGYVVNASSEGSRLCINGMSYKARNSGTANAALIVNVTPEDFEAATGSSDILNGVEFQRGLEEAAYKLCDGVIPFETYAEFRNREKAPSGISLYEGKFMGYAAAADVRSALPDYVGDAITDCMAGFAGSIEGYDSDDAIIAGIEARTSSPVRIIRDETRQAPKVRGLYPAGEGAGYAGGITSAAADGVKTALMILTTRE